MFILVPLLFFGCPRTDRLPTIDISIRDQTIEVEVANTLSSRSQGLMFRDSMPKDHGMLFVYPNNEVRSFWMLDTRIPLSIAFIDPNGEILHIENLKPMARDSTSSVYKAQYALEMNKGWFAENGIVVGDKFSGLPEPALE